MDAVNLIIPERQLDKNKYNNRRILGPFPFVKRK
jgi:hypothetical protein